MSYRYENKQNTLIFGPYPLVGLKAAREKRDEAKKLLLQGIDPAAKNREEKEAEEEAVFNSFENIARLWHEERAPGWTSKNAQVIIRRLERDIFPHVGATPIKEVKASELLATVRLIASRGALDYAHRALRYCGQIFRYAIANDCARHNVVADLQGALPTARVKHHATIIDTKKNRSASPRDGCIRRIRPCSLRSEVGSSDICSTRRNTRGSVGWN